MTTIRDIAKMTNVSVATVSRVLNESGYVNEKTKQKVLAVMKELDYKPNTIARSLNNKKTKTIGLIVPDITNPFFPELARAVEDTAQVYGYTVILCNSDEKVDKEKEYIDVLKQKYIDGIITASNAYQLYTQNSDIPVVALDRSRDENVPTVISKNRMGGKLATEHLLEIGCKKIAHIAGPPNTKPAIDRCKGYLDLVQEKDWYSTNLIIEGNFDPITSEEETYKLLQELPDIDGIFAGNDLMAVGALKAISRLGKRVPEDIALIGFDNISLSTMTVPELSTIAQPIYDMGAIATRMLIKQIEQKDTEHSFHELDVKLIQRASTKKQCEI